MSGQAGYHGTPVTQNFYTNYLKAAFVDDGSTANNKLVANTSDAIYGPVVTSNIVDVYGGNMYPDQISPLANATAAFYYNTTLTKIAAVRSQTAQAKVVYFGVGLEMVQSADIRNDIIKRTYDWFMSAVGIADQGTAGTAKIGQNYPNPANDHTTINLTDINRSMTIEIRDLTGRLQMSVPVNAKTDMVTISTSNLQNGLYLMNLVDNGKSVDVKKLFIQR